MDYFQWVQLTLDLKFINSYVNHFEYILVFIINGLFNNLVSLYQIIIILNVLITVVGEMFSEN